MLEATVCQEMFYRQRVTAQKELFYTQKRILNLKASRLPLIYSKILLVELLPIALGIARIFVS